MVNYVRCFNYVHLLVLFFVAVVVVVVVVGLSSLDYRYFFWMEHKNPPVHFETPKLAGIEAARKLSMAIRFPGLAMAQQKKKVT